MTEQIRLTEGGRRAAIEMFGPGGPAQMESGFAKREADIDRDWAEASSAWVLNGMYARHVLPTSTRELCAVAALTAMSHHSELSAHIRIALRSNPAVEVREVILQMAVYAGMPAMYEGMRIFDGIMAEPEFASGTAAANG